MGGLRSQDWPLPAPGPLLASRETIMTGRSARWGLLLVTVLSAPLAAAANGDSAVRIAAVHAPAGTDARARAALSESLRRYLSEAALADSLRPYTVSPSLTQLRRYVEDSKQARLVCM